MDSPDPPAAPNPVATATGQAQANINTAVANTALGNANVYSPLGQSTFTQIGQQQITLPDGSTASVPRYRNDVSLSSGQQSLYDQDLANQQAQAGVQGALLGNVSQSLANPVNTPTLSSSIDMSGINDARDAATNAALQRLQPQMDRDQQALESKLASQGVSQNSAAWNAAMSQLGSQQNDLRLGAVQTGDQEQQAAFQQAMDRAGFGNQTALQQYQADTQGQDQSMNLLSALQSGSQVSMPQFSGYQGGTVGQTPYSQDVYASANLNEQNYQSEVQQSQAMMSGLFGLGGKMFGLFGMSDRRLKRDVRQLGRMPNGLNLYSWHYLWGGPREVGFMADEVATVMPDAVAVHPSGFLMVDYGRAAA